MRPLSTCDSHSCRHRLWSEEAEDCGYPPTVPMASYTISRDVSTGRDSARYHCADGYMFSDGQPNVIIHCLRTGQWQDVSTGCHQLQGHYTQSYVDIVIANQCRLFSSRCYIHVVHVQVHTSTCNCWCPCFKALQFLWRYVNFR